MPKDVQLTDDQEMVANAVLDDKSDADLEKRRRGQHYDGWQENTTGK